MATRLLLTYLVFLGLNGYAQSPDQQTFDRFARASLDEFRELLSLPNDAHFPHTIEKNVRWCERNFTSRGFQVQRLVTPGAPLLLGERKSDQENAKTVLIYLQIDGQPVDTNYWNQPDPYVAVLKSKNDSGEWEEISWQHLDGKIDPEWRIFARSASDAKGPVSMFLTAIDLLKNEDHDPNFNMKIIMDFEEEMGSPNLPKAVTKYQEELAADMLVIFDGPRHLSNQPTLTFGARGITTITLEVFGPIKPQHSGHYGNYIPNPAERLARLLASMKDEQGRVAIPGFYDGVNISEEVKKILRSVPDDEALMKTALGISGTDKVAPTYQESLQYPSLNVRGLSSGWVREKSRTIVPSSAIAELDIRLVLESEPQRLLELVTAHIEQQGYLILDRLPNWEERARFSKICKMDAITSYHAFRTDFNSEIGIWLNNALIKAFGEAPIRLRTSGGSIPISPFVKELGIPAVTVPTVNRDNNQHSPNENIRLGNYFDGIKTIYAILSEPLE